jgi:hypothetical protein
MGGATSADKVNLDPAFGDIGLSSELRSKVSFMEIMLACPPKYCSKPCTSKY